MAKLNSQDSLSAQTRLAEGKLRQWLGKPLCLRYAPVVVCSLGVIASVDAAFSTRWRWALGILADGEWEVLGAWPATSAHDRQLRNHLRERGVERIGALLGDEGLARVMEVQVALLPLKASGLVALAAAAKLHDKIKRAVSRESPFPDETSAAACIASVLQKAELSELAAQRRRPEDQWRAQTRPLRAAAFSVLPG